MVRDAQVAWCRELKEKERLKDASNGKMALLRAPGRGKMEGVALNNPVGVLRAVEDMLPESSVLVADGGDFVGTAAYILRPRSSSFVTCCCFLSRSYP